jgi:hypothetical protein
MQQNVKFVHFTKASTPFTIGYAINDADSTLTYSTAVLSPRDQYVKRIARNIVEGRIRKGVSCARTHTVSLSELQSLKTADIIDFVTQKESLGDYEPVYMLQLGDHF